MKADPVNASPDRGGRLLRLALARPRANILDAEMIASLQAHLDEHREQSDLAAVVLTAEGTHFSFGASVEEHLPGRCDAMLQQIHRLIITLVEFPVPVLVAVRGQCLGGGMEVALAGGLIFAAPDAKFGQPEIRLGVFAPAASCLLPERAGHGFARDLLWSGRSAGAEEALQAGLVHAVADDPEAAALAWFDEHLSGLSSSSLRHAVRAANADYCERVKRGLAAVEAQYLGELMATRDAVEGLQAFMEKRAPRWEHR